MIRSGTMIVSKELNERCLELKVSGKSGEPERLEKCMMDSAQGLCLKQGPSLMIDQAWPVNLVHCPLLSRVPLVVTPSWPVRESELPFPPAQVSAAGGLCDIRKASPKLWSARPLHLDMRI